MTRIKGDWIDRPATQRVMAAINDSGAKAYFVGGCVRNALFGTTVSDVDIATDAPPDRVSELATQAGLKAIPTGIKHGTVTVVSGGIPHEITTFRKDLETDGRRAIVTFSDQMADDARRRDFTMNALYADAEGRVYDPLGGLDDLTNRRVRFIEDPTDRIKEDYLRILRFFRFFAWYGDPLAGMDAEGLAAIAANLDGLDRLSRERVGAEMKKLLTAADPAPAVASMKHCGVLGRILSGADDRGLAPLIDLEQGVNPDPMRRLAVLGGEDVGDRLRLSRYETGRLTLLRREIAGNEPVKLLGYRHGTNLAIDIALLRVASLGGHLPRDFQAAAAAGAGKTLPIKSSDLMPAFTGPALGEKLAELEAAWIRSDFKLTKSQLLA